MHSLRGRFILSHLLPLFIIVPLAGIALFYVLETQLLLNNLQQDLLQQANFVSTEAAGQSSIWEDPAAAQAFLERLSQQFQNRVMLLGPSGEPLFGTTTTDASDTDTPANDGTVSYSFSTQTAVIYVPVRDIDQELVGIVEVTQEVQDLSSHFVRLRWLLMGVLLLELVVGGLIGLVLALRLERPIHTLTSAVTDIAAGHPIEDVPVNGPDELRLLAQAVNTLSRRLKELEETRRQLLANVVHELGRPLGAVRSAIHVLRQDENQSPALRQELLSGIDAELERLQPLLDDLTRLHGQKLGPRELMLRPLSLSDWLPPLLKPWQAAAQEKGVVWQVDLTPDLPPLQADPDRLAQAVGNLLSNAIKYTPPDGKVSVESGRNGGDLWLRVSDTGPGISEEDLPHLFSPFFRGQQQSRFPRGLGLGLTIAEEIAEAHNGYVQVESDLGRGSQFTIHLPLKVNLNFS
ncbi:MAG: HAMP domain-containing sensor histidine kinase [Candidatus Promineifilaceae bacterium]